MITKNMQKFMNFTQAQTAMKPQKLIRIRRIP